MKLAFYVANEGSLVDKGVDLWTGLYGYSHIEIVFSDGMSFSASPREGKVRFKKIDFSPKRWVFHELEMTELEEAKIRAQAENLIGRKYDYKGIIGWFVIPIKKQENNQWWCSEIIAYLLKWKKFRVHPNKMAKHYGLHRQKFRFKVRLLKAY